MAPRALLALPPELRNVIYEHTLISDEPIQIHRTHSAETITPTSPHPLLHVCRQIRNEASPIYYSGNIFQIRIWWAQNAEEVLGHWLSVLTDEDHGCVRCVRLDDGKEGWWCGEGCAEYWEQVIEGRRRRLEEVGELVDGVEVWIRDWWGKWVVV